MFDSYGLWYDKFDAIKFMNSNSLIIRELFLRRIYAGLTENRNLIPSEIKS